MTMLRPAELPAAPCRSPWSRSPSLFRGRRARRPKPPLPPEYRRASAVRADSFQQTAMHKKSRRQGAAYLDASFLSPLVPRPWQTIGVSAGIGCGKYQETITWGPVAVNEAARSLAPLCNSPDAGGLVPQPHARTAAVLRDELDASRFERRLDRV